jgi:hypothetical protein
LLDIYLGGVLKRLEVWQTLNQKLDSLCELKPVGRYSGMNPEVFDEVESRLGERMAGTFSQLVCGACKLDELTVGAQVDVLIEMSPNHWLDKGGMSPGNASLTKANHTIHWCVSKIYWHAYIYLSCHERQERKR